MSGGRVDLAECLQPDLLRMLCKLFLRFLLLFFLLLKCLCLLDGADLGL